MSEQPPERDPYNWPDIGDPWPEAAEAMEEINARPPAEPDESEPPF